MGPPAVDSHTDMSVTQQVIRAYTCSPLDVIQLICPLVKVGERLSHLSAGSLWGLVHPMKALRTSPDPQRLHVQVSTASAGDIQRDRRMTHTVKE